MSEGLNLQTSGLIINYDMPWNFMRVEQRIGRLDRIGGKPVVYVHNYFYRDTVEQQIYENLSEDFDWFENVVGPASPVLGSIEKIIEDAAMAQSDQAGEAVRTAIGKLKKGVDEARAQPIDMSQVASDPHDAEPQPVLTLGQIKDELLSNPLTRAHLIPSDDQPTYALSIDGHSDKVTFDRHVANGQGVMLITYGSPALDRILENAGIHQNSMQTRRPAIPTNHPDGMLAAAQPGKETLNE